MAFPTGWGRKQKITIQSSQVSGSGSHTDFPFLVTLNHLNSEIVDAGSNSALNGGDDVRFSSDSGGAMQLACEIVSFTTNASAPSRDCEVWVKVPSVSTSSNTDIYIWYKKSGESQPAVTDTYGRNAVWSNFDFLSHDMITDSSGNNTLTIGNAGAVTDSPYGKNAYLFDGSSDYITSGVSGITIDGNLTVSMWGRDDGAGSSFPRAVYCHDGNDWFALGIDTDSSDNAWAYFSGAGTSSGSGPEDETGSPSAGTWCFVAATMTEVENGETLRVNGTDQADQYYGDWSAGDTSILSIGRRSSGGNYFDGALARLGVRSSVASSDLLDTEYNNQNSPSSFASAGTSESVTPLSLIDSGEHSHVGDNLSITGGADPISYVGGAVNDSSSGSNLSITLPTHESDDFAVAFCYGDEAGSVGSWSETASSGWTKLREDNHTSGRDRVTAIFYKKLGASETNPTFNFSVTEQISASVNIFRNVDTVTPFDVAEAVTSNQNDATPPNAAITTTNDHAGLLLFHASTHDDITTAGAPTDYTVATAVNGAAFDHRQQVVAYQLGSGASGLKSPGDWTHTVSVAATAEYSCYTLALRMATGGATILSLGDGVQAHAADNLVLSQIHDLSVANCLHVHSVSIGALIEHKALATAQAQHGLSSDNMVLDLSFSLDLGAALHGHVADPLIMGQVHNISLSDGFHDLVSDQLSVSTLGALAVQSAVHSLLNSGISLGYTTDLVVAAASTSHFADALLLNQIHVLAATGGAHSQSAETLVFQTMISGADALHDLVSDAVAFSQVHMLRDLDDVLDHGAEAPFVRIPPGIWGLVGETITGWSISAIAAGGWSEQASGSNDWSEQDEGSSNWLEQDENDDSWSDP